MQSQTHTAVSGASGGLVAAGYYAAKALYHAIAAAVAKIRQDDESTEIHWEKVKETLSFDNLVRIVASSVAQMAIVALVGPGAPIALAGLGAGVVQVTLFAVVQSILESVIARKNNAGGWMPWIGTFFADRRRKVWTGFIFESMEHNITDELRCTICREIVCVFRWEVLKSCERR